MIMRTVVDVIVHSKVDGTDFSTRLILRPAPHASVGGRHRLVDPQCHFLVSASDEYRDTSYQIVAQRW